MILNYGINESCQKKLKTCSPNYLLNAPLILFISVMKVQFKIIIVIRQLLSKISMRNSIPILKATQISKDFSLYSLPEDFLRDGKKSLVIFPISQLLLILTNVLNPPN